MAALPTSNLSVALILSTLGITSKDTKDIFYLSGSLRSISNFGTIVNKNGLDPAYCSGATADDRLQNLLTYRNLSRFKGYTHSSQLLELYTTALYNNEEHVDTSALAWATVRNAVSGTVNDSCIYAAMLNSPVYVISRGVLRFNFSGTPINTIATAKLILPAQSPYTLTSNAFAFLLPNNSTIVPSDYSAYTTQLSNEGNIVSNVEEILLSAAGISAMQSAMNAGGLITLMLLHKKDKENTTPVAVENLQYVDYPLCKVTFTY